MILNPSVSLHAARACLALAALGMAGAAVAQTSDDVALTDLAAAPQNGTLANVGTTWKVDVGGPWYPSANPPPYSLYRLHDQLQTWTFGKTVDLQFTVIGLNTANEGVKLPSGTRCVLPAGVTSITWTPATGILQRDNTTVNADGPLEIKCVLHEADTLTLDNRGLGSASASLGLSALKVLIPKITSATPPDTGTVGTAYDHTVTATDSDLDDGVALTYTATGLPPGLSINPNTGAISGTPTTPGSYPVTIVARNGNVESLPQTVTIVIAAGPVAAVPTLEVWGLGLLGALLGGVAAWRRRFTQG